MAQLTTISLSRFTATVQAAVKTAVQKHPKFKIDPPQAVAVSYFIRGIPVPESVLANVSLGETQSFANDLAAHIGAAQPEVLAEVHRGTGQGQGAVYAAGGHLILGIPRVDAVLLEK